MTQTHKHVLIGAVLIIAAGLSVLFVTSTSAAASPATAIEEEAGEEVRSGMTLKEIESTTGVPRDYIVTYLQLPGCLAGDKNKPVHEWLSRHNLTVTDLREAVGRYRAGHRFHPEARH